jgi:multidrug efflux system outer membrane protein
VGVYIFLVASGFFLLSGCMKLGPDYHRPDIGVNIPATYQQAPTERTVPVPEDRWWQVFSDEDLNRLVEEALTRNLDIKRATAAVLEARAQLVDTRADRFPRVGLDGRIERQQRPAGVSVPGQTFSMDRRISNYDLSLPASFEVDLWGRLARAEEAARADLLRAEENRRTVAQTVVAETITLYLQMENSERGLLIAERLTETIRRSVALVESRYKRGLTSVLDLRQARRTLARAEATLPPIRQNLGTTQQQLAVLLGRYPESRPPRLQPDDYFKRLAPVPPGLPSELLMRRPDVREAEARLMVLNAEIGVKKASRFPSITLTGAYGYSSTDLDDLFKYESELWSIATGVTQSIFDAGKLKAGQRAAEARYQQGVAEYARTVLNAFAEVESAFLTREEQLKRRKNILDFVLEARATQRIAESRYERGLNDYLTVLDAQQTRFEAERDLLEVDLAILTNRVALHRALGGGWAQLPPVALEKVDQTTKGTKVTKNEIR